LVKGNAAIFKNSSFLWNWIHDASFVSRRDAKAQNCLQSLQLCDTNFLYKLKYAMPYSFVFCTQGLRARGVVGHTSGNSVPLRENDIASLRDISLTQPNFLYRINSGVSGFLPFIKFKD
jgi:hypothetical protein